MMDAVELAVSEAAAVPKLMGSEDFGGTSGDVGTVVGKAQAGKSEGKSALIRPYVGVCSRKGDFFWYLWEKIFRFFFSFACNICFFV